MSAVSFPEYVAGFASAHYGLRILELGEDGGTLVVLGHHDDRRTLAALSHYARTVWGYRLDGLHGLASPTPDEVQRVRAIVTHACHRGWLAEERVPTSEIEVLDPAAGQCPDCLTEADSTWALLYRDDAQHHPASFPVTVWEYDA